MLFSLAGALVSEVRRIVFQLPMFSHERDVVKLPKSIFGRRLAHKICLQASNLHAWTKPFSQDIFWSSRLPFLEELLHETNALKLPISTLGGSLARKVRAYTVGISMCFVSKVETKSCSLDPGQSRQHLVPRLNPKKGHVWCCGGVCRVAPCRPETHVPSVPSIPSVRRKLDPARSSTDGLKKP